MCTDYEKWEVWASASDIGWGPWCIECVIAAVVLHSLPFAQCEDSFIGAGNRVGLQDWVDEFLDHHDAVLSRAQHLCLGDDCKRTFRRRSP